MRQLTHVAGAGLLALALCGLTARTAEAQIDGLHLDVGLSLLTKAGSLQINDQAIESKAGWALRGRARFGIGLASIAGEIQQSVQGYDSPPAGAPDGLGGTFLGVSVAAHPFEILGIVPYVTLGLGNHYFSDDLIDSGDASRLLTYGLGVMVASHNKIAIDVEFRLFRQDKLRLTGAGSAFKYDPKVLSFMLSFRR
jgi:hypothetical protein